MLLPLLRVLLARVLTVGLHEGCHVLAAALLGYHEWSVSVIAWQPCARIAKRLAPRHRSLVRHAGWVGSLVVATLCTWRCLSDAAWSCWWGVAVAWLTAADAIHSDLLGAALPAAAGATSGAGGCFYCGNFGLLLINGASKHLVGPLLRKMIKITMMRGAQSAGVVTYTRQSGRVIGGVGKRHRVVNGKRTDLADKLLRKGKEMVKPANIQATQIFQGHTRFATTSIADFDGTHPHQWSAPTRERHWAAVPGQPRVVSAMAHVEANVTHNGDLDFFDIHGVTYELGDVRDLLTSLLHAKPSCTVDSLCVAGLLELLRTKGLWRASVRYGYLFGALSGGELL